MDNLVLLVKMGDYLYGIDQVQERNDVGFNQGDYLGWPRARGNAQAMAQTLKKYLNTQLVPVFGEDAQKAVEENLSSDEMVDVAVTGLPVITPVLKVLDARYGASLVMEHEGSIPTIIRNKYINVNKSHGLWWDRALDRNYVPAKDIAAFDFESYKSDLEAIGFSVNPMPSISKQPEQKEISLEVALGRISSNPFGGNYFVCFRSHGKFVFRFSFSSDLNALFGNRNGKISGIVEAIAPGHDMESVFGKWARVTDSLELAEEIISKARALLPEWIFVIDGVKQARQVLADRQAKMQAPIPAVIEKLNPEFKPFAFQNEGIRFIEISGGNCLLGWDMGTGKTITSLSWSVIRNLRVLVVCPKVVRRTWIQEAQKFYPSVFNQFNSVELSPKALKKYGMPNLTNVRLASVNYASFAKFQEAIVEAGFDLLIVDESHSLKNEKAKITQQLMAVSTLFKHKILLSGTAIKNKKEELFTQIEMIRPGFYPNKRAVKFSTIGGLWHNMQGFYNRKSKSDVLKDMPEKLHSVVELEVENCPDFTGSIEFDRIAKMKSDVAIAKADATIEFVREILDSSDSNVLVFSDSVEVVKKIHESLGDDVCIIHHGQMSDDAREKAKADFQREDCKQRVFVSTRQSLAVGATLTRADKVVFNDLCWTVADTAQAEDRAYRIGQKNTVNVYWVQAANNNWDSKVVGILKKKWDISRKVLEGKQVSTEELEWMNKPISPEDFVE
jgi:SWI/SNF-related matrix-associated actin-dependent regulator 1 of chromatin subfamily A